MKKKSRPVPDDIYVPEDEMELELKGRHDVCSCDEDPAWCPVHQLFA
jgi:hypothetical protein